MEIETAGLRGPANSRLSFVLKARSPSWRLVTLQQEACSVHPTYGHISWTSLPETPGQTVSHPPDKIAAEDEAQHEDEDACAEDDHVDVEGKVLKLMWGALSRTCWCSPVPGHRNTLQRTGGREKAK